MVLLKGHVFRDVTPCRCVFIDVSKSRSAFIYDGQVSTFVTFTGRRLVLLSAVNTKIIFRQGRVELYLRHRHMPSWYTREQLNRYNGRDGPVNEHVALVE